MLKRNKPEAVGYELGAHLARFADQAEAALRARGVQVPERCSTCAFRAGTTPNGCVTSVMDALKCAIEHEPFLCHHDKEHRTPCAGWLAWMADSGRYAKPGVAPWPFSDEIGPVEAANPDHPTEEAARAHIEAEVRRIHGGKHG